ncbi:MAG: penicillin-binding protein 2 [Cyanomargarita calcarea GSE-NOS-MK-12-04C]|jgi:penicillin-binding protein 2|uniref:Penicillin-binding protein 2 n=1 Tax=Cyanomargarita calcarea GSE-NOS-MK-12-04C TaxID=2839659 RepID=A0A951QI21_9CYAN|nr:penicillin-binding protein 2 [Cyanomargarita calcarea GSE-NOS-MK-12-04C]
MALLNSGFGKKKETVTVGKGFRPLFLILLTLSSISAMSVRLAHLQVVEGKKHSDRAQSNRVRTIPKLPERGNVFDRNGKLLATTRYPRSVYLWPMAHTKPGWQEIAGPRLSQILDIPQTEIEAKLEQAGPNSSTLVRIARDLTMEEITALKEYHDDLPDVEVHTEAVRYYPHKQELAHVLGYTRELTAEQLKVRKDDGYRLGDVIGQMGVEKAFEKTLRGEWGGQQVEVDGRGRPLKTLGEKQATPGKDLNLTIDLDVQKAAEKALQGKNGSIVVMNPNNGAILAMVSHPTFDPNIFSQQKPDRKELRKVLQGEEHPLVNRALSAFPPASTFKIVTTAAGLESGKFSANVVLQTYGSLNFGGVNFGEWNHAGFGPLGWTGAMANSSDTFFYQIGRGVGGQTMIEWTRKFGFGKRTGFEFETEESRGLVPDDKWTQKVLKTPWTIGHTINMSIGQGALLSTPLQVAVMFAVPANGGYRVQPHLLKDNEDAKKWRESVGMKPTTIKILRDGLRKVITEGTGKALNSPTVAPIAGKTGTAEAWKKGVKQNHAWFGGYAPAGKPEIVVVSFAEHSGGGGGSVAAPMALSVMEEYFQKKYPDKYQKPEKKQVKTN